MTVTEFRDAVYNGLGRAILYARANDTRPFADVIVDACLHCYAVDPQFEGIRAPFMLELIGLSNDPHFHYAEILRSLADCSDDWDGVQRLRLASGSGH